MKIDVNLTTKTDEYAIIQVFQNGMWRICTSGMVRSNTMVRLRFFKVVCPLTSRNFNKDLLLDQELRADYEVY